MTKTPVHPPEIWSAVTCHRFGRLGDSLPKQGRVERPGRAPGSPRACDGDKSPAESGDKSPHSKAGSRGITRTCARHSSFVIQTS